MKLVALIIVMFFGGFVACIVNRWNPRFPQWVALITLCIEAFLTAGQYSAMQPIMHLPNNLSTVWFDDFNRAWITRFGISFHLAADGISQLLIALTILLGFMAVSSSWTEIKDRQGFYYFCLLTCLGGTIGVFLAVDLFLFFFFWEIMIIPMYFLISIWGHENRIGAAIKFVIFTQISSLCMLLAMVVLVLFNHTQNGVYTFDYFQLLNSNMHSNQAVWLMLGFYIAFAVKLPTVPFHTWLPDAHTQAPTGASVLLAGVLLKTGAYGLLRFVIPLFPEAAVQFAPVAMLMGTVSILYSAMMAYAQSDMKRLIAYTSVSHMGFILLGLFSWNLHALQGAVVTMLAHGISASALFMIAGALQERLHTREMAKMGGFWPVFPHLSALTLFFAMATLGLPGLGNFIGELLVLLGAFKMNVLLASVAALILILSPVYSLSIVQKVLHGPLKNQPDLSDIKCRELTSFAVLVFSTLWLGLIPQAVLNDSAPALKQIIHYIEVTGH